MEDLRQLISVWSLESTLSDVELKLGSLNLEVVDKPQTTPTVNVAAALEPTKPCPVVHSPESNPTGWYREQKCPACGFWDMGRIWLHEQRSNLDFHRVWVCDFPNNVEIAPQQFWTRTDAYQYGRWLESNDPTLVMRLRHLVPLEEWLECWKGHYSRKTAAYAIALHVASTGATPDTESIKAQLAPEKWTQFLMNCREAHKKEWTTELLTEHLWWITSCPPLREFLSQKHPEFRQYFEMRRRRSHIWVHRAAGLGYVLVVRDPGMTDFQLWQKIMNASFEKETSSVDQTELPALFYSLTTTHKVEPGRVVVRRGAFHWVPQMASEPPDVFRERAASLDTLPGVAYKAAVSPEDRQAGVAKFARTKVIGYNQQPWETMREFMERVEKAPGEFIKEDSLVARLRVSYLGKHKSGRRFSSCFPNHRDYLIVYQREAFGIHRPMSLRDDIKEL